MSSKYLDYNGLQTLVDDIKDYVEEHDEPIHLTQEEYDALTPEQKENKLYFITDSESSSLPIASSSKLGGIKVGSGLDIASNGVLSADVTEIAGSDAYNSSITYQPGDMCVWGAAAWKCLVACQDETPEEGTYWTQVSLKSLNKDLTNISDHINQAYIKGTQNTAGSEVYIEPSTIYDEQIFAVYGGISNATTPQFSLITVNKNSQNCYETNLTNNPLNPVFEGTNIWLTSKMKWEHFIVASNRPFNIIY